MTTTTPRTSSRTATRLPDPRPPVTGEPRRPAPDDGGPSRPAPGGGPGLAVPRARPHGAESTGGEADPATAAALFADPARARVLMALADGRALPASVLADEAGVSAPAASAHLAKLREGGLVSMEKSGRHRYYRLTGPQVATALEALTALAPPRPVRSLRAHTRAAALRGPAAATTISRAIWACR